jgi:hypothetical protein
MDELQFSPPNFLATIIAGQWSCLHRLTEILKREIFPTQNCHHCTVAGHVGEIQAACFFFNQQATAKLEKSRRGRVQVKV